MNLEGRKLTTWYPRNHRCDRCDFPLNQSEWNETNVVFSTKTSRLKGYICVQCASGTTRNRKCKVTTAELDEFTSNLVKSPVKLVVIAT